MYDIDFKPIKKRKEKDISFIVFGILFIFVLLYFVYGIGNGNLLILGAIFPMFLFPMLFIIIGIFNLNKTNKRIKIINELNKTGKLIKGLPYKLEHTNIKRNNMVISVPAVDYQLPDGTIVHLTALTCYHYSNKDKDGLADLIIDETNPDNYFIDFEINRIGGNQPSDYYQRPNEVNQQVNDPYSSNYGTFK